MSPVLTTLKTDDINRLNNARLHTDGVHEQTTKGFGKINICITRFGIRIGDRKYLNEYTPFGSVSLWDGLY